MVEVLRFHFNYFLWTWLEFFNSLNLLTIEVLIFCFLPWFNCNSNIWKINSKNTKIFGVFNLHKTICAQNFLLAVFLLYNDVKSCIKWFKFHATVMNFTKSNVHLLVNVCQSKLNHICDVLMYDVFILHEMKMLNDPLFFLFLVVGDLKKLGFMSCNTF